MGMATRPAAQEVSKVVIDAHSFEWAFLSFYTETNREIL